MVRLPRIAITMGDPAGVGPELCLRLLRDERVRAACRGGFAPERRRGNLGFRLARGQ